MPMQLIVATITKKHLAELAKERFGDLVKVVVDVKQKIMVIGGELHSDEEGFLLNQGSSQENLWGINLYPDSLEADFIEFDSMINLRPSHGNRSCDVLDVNIRNEIIKIVNQLVR